MPYKRKKRRTHSKDKTDRKKDSIKSIVALGFLLANLFQWSYFLRRELLVSSALSTVLGFVGFWIAFLAKKQIARHMGTMQGEAKAVVAYWANLLIALISLLLLSWLILMGILRGEFL